MLVETVHALPMYKNHKRYVQEIMMKETPEILPQELSVQLNITIGEATVILDEIRGNGDTGVPRRTSDPAQKRDRSLLDFGK